VQISLLVERLPGVATVSSIMEGCKLGIDVGAVVGSVVGLKDGCAVGDIVGLFVGFELGNGVDG